MFENYYQTELTYLRDMGKAFAAKHPSLAGMLSERATDPEVERLLEGFAFVAARMRQRIDDAAPELVESLAELLLPHVLRPTPASTILEFRPVPRTLRGKVRVPRGARVTSRAVRGTRCTFSTSTDLDVLPLQICGSQLDESAPSRPELRLRFAAEPGAEAGVFTREGLRLHLHGDPAMTTQLYLWLSRHVSGVSVHSEAGRMELPARVVRPSGFAPRDALLPWPTSAPHSARVLLEYFTLPAKFLFVELHELDRAAHLARDSFEIVLRFDRPPPLGSRLPDDMLRLHCVPVVNLFEIGAEPVRAALDERPTLLRAAGMDPSHMEVFAVQSVIGASRDGRRSSYGAFHEFRHLADSSNESGFYKLTRQASPVDEGTHTSIRLQREPAAALQRGDETLSIQLLCTNRALARELQVGDIQAPSAEIASGLTCSNIAPISAPTRAPLGADLSWYVLGHLASTRRSLADLQALQTLLGLYGEPGRTEYASGRVHRARIDALRSVQVETITRVLGGAAARGSLYSVELDQAGFASEGDAFLFATVLHRLLALDARINSYADLRVRIFPSAREWLFLAELAP